MRSLKILAVALLAWVPVILSGGSAHAYEVYTVAPPWTYASGRVWYVDDHHVGFDVSAKDTAADGHCVYLAAQGFRENVNAAVDGATGWIRVGGNICGNGTMGRWVATNHQVLESWNFGSTKYRIAICKDISHAIDQCSAASAWTTKDRYHAG